MIKDKLTPAQFKVADKVAEGLTNKQVAKELGLSERTVRRHLYMMYKDLGIISRYKLISMMFTERLTISIRGALLDNLGTRSRSNP